MPVISLPQTRQMFKAQVENGQAQNIVSQKKTKIIFNLAARMVAILPELFAAGKN